MNDHSVAMCGPPPKWYRWYRFPLLPKLNIRQADRCNTKQITFHWLCFRAWTMDSIRFSASIDIEECFWAKIQIPFLIFGIWIPLMPYNILQKWWRKPIGFKRPHEEIEKLKGKEK